MLLSADISRRQAARTAGLSWLAVIASGIWAEFFIRMKLIVPGDPAATAANIAGSDMIFRLSIASDLVMLSFDIIATLALYVLLRPVNRGLALLAAFFRLVMAAILGLNLVNLSAALNFAQSAGSVFTGEQLSMLTQQFLNAHGAGYDIGLVFFGLHLLVLGYLVFTSGYLPKILGALLLCASLGYVVDSFANIILRGSEGAVAVTAAILIAAAVIAETSLSLWLILRSGRIPQTES